MDGMQTGVDLIYDWLAEKLGARDREMTVTDKRDGTPSTTPPTSCASISPMSASTTCGPCTAP